MSSQHHTADSTDAAADPVEIDLSDGDGDGPTSSGESTGGDAASGNGADRGDEHAAEAAGEPCDDWPLSTRIEALLLTSDRPLTTARLGELLGIASKGQAKRIQQAVAELNEQYEQSGRSFRVEQIAGGWQLYTVEQLSPLMTRLHKQRQSARLSQAALETLSIIAYRQPILRAEIEAIRGVASGEVLRGLMERRLVRITGRAEEIGRPMLYGTTRQFLEVFGLSGLDDLPPVEGLSGREQSQQGSSTKEAKGGSEQADDVTTSDDAGDQRRDDASVVDATDRAVTDHGDETPDDGHEGEASDAEERSL